jgi:hypothetical protein
MRPFFDISADILAIKELLENAGGEFTDDEVGRALRHGRNAGNAR